MTILTPKEKAEFQALARKIDAEMLKQAIEKAARTGNIRIDRKEDAKCRGGAGC